MTWDPEQDDPTVRPPIDPHPEPSDVGADRRRDFGDEPAPAWRDAAPDPLQPIDPDAPVSGHVPPPDRAAGTPLTEAPEHDWGHAAELIYPTFRPVGTQGAPIESLADEALGPQTGRGHATPIVDGGPCDLTVVYAMQAGGFDILVNPEHVQGWGIRPQELQDAALRNLADWSSSAPWTDEVSGERRLLSSDTGDGWDAVRILLPEVREHLARELGSAGRILVGLPERHLLVAGTLREGDEEFAALLGDFVVERAGDADEPVDRRVFELLDGELVEFTTRAT